MLSRLLLVGLALFLQTGVFAQAKKFTVTAYYAGGLEDIDRYDPANFSHIIFSFCHLKGSRLNVDTRRDTLRIQKLVALKKKNPVLKVLLSLGGWGGCATCSDAFSSQAGRNEFASSVKELSAYFSTDGIDLDWEYPAVEGYPGHAYKPQDKQNFTALVAALRNHLGPQAEISFAAGGFEKFVNEAVEWEKVMPLVDRVNLMTYDLVSGYATVTGHHTPLHSTPQQKESADNAISRLLQKGVPAHKIVIGAAFYARVWEGVSSVNNGLYQKGTFKTTVAFRDFDQTFAAAKGFAHFWDETAKAPYLYNSAQGLFATFDDKKSVAEKTNYVVAKGLNGIMFWELANDAYSDGLLDAIHGALSAK